MEGYRACIRTRILGTILPLCFLSGIFIPFGNGTPSWLVWIARIFPVRHFAAGMLAGFVGTPFDWTDVLVVAARGVAGLLVAVASSAGSRRRNEPATITGDDGGRPGGPPCGRGSGAPRPESSASA